MTDLPSRDAVSKALSYRQLLGAADVRALLLGTLLVRLAGRMFALAIVLYALARTGSPMLAGWLAFAATAPGLAISPVAGALIDRVGSVWAITVDMTASAACVAALIVVDRLGWASAPVLLALVSLFSLTSPLTWAGVRALLPRLVPVTALARANALDTAIHGLSDIAGPALAGAIVGFGGPSLALGHDRNHLHDSSAVRRHDSPTARPIATPRSAAGGGTRWSAACRATPHIARARGVLFAL